MHVHFQQRKTGRIGPSSLRWPRGSGMGTGLGLIALSVGLLCVAALPGTALAGQKTLASVADASQFDWNEYLPAIAEKPLRQRICSANRRSETWANGVTFHCPAVVSSTQLDLRVRYVEAGDKPVAEFTLSNAAGQPVFEVPLLWGDFDDGLRVESADYNNDGRPDIKVVAAYNGLGLAGLNMRAMFFLSIPHGYKLYAVDTMTPAKTFKGADGRVRFVHRSVIYADSQDQRGHNYWVHRFFELGPQGMRPSGDEPVWVMYTSKPQRQPTRLLSRVQKKAALKAAGRDAEPQVDVIEAR